MKKFLLFVTLLGMSLDMIAFRPAVSLMAQIPKNFPKTARQKFFNSRAEQIKNRSAKQEISSVGVALITFGFYAGIIFPFISVLSGIRDENQGIKKELEKMNENTSKRMRIEEYDRQDRARLRNGLDEV